MTIIDRITSDALESVEWDFQHGQLADRGAYHYITDTLLEYVHESIDRHMIYTHDIISTWTDYGYPEPEEGTSDGSVHGGIVAAVYECLMSDVDVWEIAARFVDSHASLLPGDLDTDDVVALLDYLAEYARSEH